MAEEVHGPGGRLQPEGALVQGRAAPYGGALQGAETRKKNRASRSNYIRNVNGAMIPRLLAAIFNGVPVASLPPLNYALIAAQLVQGALGSEMKSFLCKMAFTGGPTCDTFGSETLTRQHVSAGSVSISANSSGCAMLSHCDAKIAILDSIEH